MQLERSPCCYGIRHVVIFDYALLKELLLCLDQPQRPLQRVQEDEEANLYYNKHPTDVPDLTSVFQYRLDAQIETIVLFLVQEQGEVAYRLQELLMKQRLIPVKSSSNVVIDR
jgi:hypothetical protein